MNMSLVAFLYFRQSVDGLTRRVFVHGEQQSADNLIDAGVHLQPMTLKGQEIEDQLCRQRGWLLNHVRSVEGVSDAKPLDPVARNVDFDVYRTDGGDWAEIMQGISDVIALVLGRGAIICMLDYPL